MTDQRARFTRVSISNYRSIGPDVSIELGDFTALVGTNGSGKSNVADTFRFLSNALNDGLESAIEDRHGFDALRRVVDGRRGVVKLRFELSHRDWSGEYEFALTATRGNEYRVSSETAMIRSADGATITRFETRDGEVKQAPEGLEKPARDRLRRLLAAMPIEGGFAASAATSPRTIGV